MRSKHFVIVLILLLLALPAAPAQAGGVVSACNETALKAALTGGGTVTFSCSGTITLTSGVWIAANTTIDGSGQTVTLSGGDAHQVFFVLSGVTLSLNKLTIADGNAGEGGGIRNDGTLTVSNSTFSGNSVFNEGGGIYNNTSGTLTVSNSTFADNQGNNSGGGIANYGTLTVSNSTFAGNRAGYGGGIYNGGTATLKNTIVANSPAGGNCAGTISDGGHNLSYPDGTCPGIHGDPVLGPLQANGGPTQTLALGAGSAARDAADAAICAAAPVNNLDQRGVARPQGAGCDIGAFEAAGSTIVTNANDSGPGSLRQILADADTGGIITFAGDTHILLNFPLIIARDATIDGAGRKVTISGGVAVRVFMVGSGVSLSLNHLTVADGEAPYNVGGGIYNDGGTVTVNNSTVSGNRAGYGGGIYNRDGTVTVSNSTFSGNSATNTGGGIYNFDGTVTVSNSTFSGNGATNTGGGIYNYGGTATLKNTIVANNPGGNCGGTISDDGHNLSYPDGTCPGIHGDPVLGPLQANGGPTQTMALGAGSAARDAADPAVCAAAPVNGLDQRGVARPQGAGCDIGAFEAARTTIVTNANDSGPGSLRQALADADTGGIIIFAGDTHIVLGSTLNIARDVGIDGSGQTVTISGGGAVRVFVVNSGVTLSLNKLTVADGLDANTGGGILNNGTLTVTNSTFSGNTASGAGGGIHNNGTLSVSNSIFSGNSATGFAGGGIVNAGTLTVSDSTFSGNQAIEGGGIFNDIGKVAAISNSSFSHNTVVGNGATQGAEPTRGAGIFNNGTLTVSNSTFSVNQAGFYGGGIFNDYGKLTVTNNIFSGNTATSGGGIQNDHGELTVHHSTFSGNAGGIRNGDGTLTVTNSTFSNNNTFGSGGGIHNDSGTVTVASSTFADNTNYGFGPPSCGGINNGGTLTVSNSTFSGNHGPYTGGIYNRGSLTVTNCTFSGNSATLSGNVAGGIYNDTGGTLMLSNTIVVNSTGGNCYGTITFGIGNLSYPDDSCGGMKLDPKLGPLQNNGGPTQTMALGSGSAALDAAIDDICMSSPVNNLDQRGVIRPQGAHCDIGAYESSRSVYLPLIRR